MLLYFVIDFVIYGKARPQVARKLDVGRRTDTLSRTKSRFVYDEILEEIKKSIYVGGDETGIKVNGKKWWVWVWQNVKNTYLAASNNRGFQTIEALFPKGLPNTIVGTQI